MIIDDDNDNDNDNDDHKWKLETWQTGQNQHEARDRSGRTNHSSHGNAAEHKSSLNQLPLSYLMYHSILHVAVRIDLRKSEK